MQPPADMPDLDRLAFYRAARAAEEKQVKEIKKLQDRSYEREDSYKPVKESAKARRRSQNVR